MSDPLAITKNEDGTFNYPSELEVFTRNGIKAALALCGGDEMSAGWRTDPETGESLNVQTEFGIKVALIHSEISEALEAHRKNKMDDHLTHRWGVEVEFADALIRIFSLAQWMGLDLSGAMMEKLAYNRQRADHKLENRAKEGGKKF
jgi:NTP pyrophosphatase (non-canonical NTP hydrolase)